MVWNRRGEATAAAGRARRWCCSSRRGNPLQRRSLYVGDLGEGVTEMDSRAAFAAVGPVLFVRLCRCSVTGKSLCYGYVNFFSHSLGHWRC
uniref:Polyadenylate-binding family protein n=1 Tax=Rhizophora mucronata TaxID=61149 RepID=A0A2P2IWH7_RHIMU